MGAEGLKTAQNNQKAAQLKRERIAFQDRIEELKSRNDEADPVVNLADYGKKQIIMRKKEAAMLMIYKISEDWNI